MYKTKSLRKFIFSLLLTIASFCAFLYSLIIKPLHSEPVDAYFVLKMMFLSIIMLCVCLVFAFRSDAELENGTLICTNLFRQKEIPLSQCTVDAGVSLSSRFSAPSFVLIVDSEKFDLAFTRENRDLIFDALKNCKFTSTSISELEAKISKENVWPL